MATTEIPPRRLILLRHGETTYNATRRMQGQLDTELSEVGLAQAAAVAKHFEHFTPAVTRIVSSDLQRAARTADAVGEILNVDVSRDQRLRETLLGVWQARTHEEIDAEYPGLRYRWRHDAEWAPEGAETRLEVAQRMRAVVDELLDDESWPGSTFMLVAHGGAIAALTAILMEVPISHYTMFNGLRNTAWVELSAKHREDGSLGWYLGAFNAQVTCP
ncbi:histidine phosphatase family protein [Corynebacterium sp. H113]|uniref:histidine phosphatase family protein n=1 Tax=Corynebacterium sp. H113 TaxID=3133419 RepID=UPI0030A8E1F5